MAYFPDLSPYEYDVTFNRPETVNVGWLAWGHSFATGITDEVVINALWDYCKISVAQMRGDHQCNLGHGRPDKRRPGDLDLLLGSAEIRIFDDSGAIYAAPNLIYHYVVDHAYKMPEQVEIAVLKGPRPPQSEYLEKLNKLQLDWDYTRILDPVPGYYRPTFWPKRRGDG